jgi:hypothetical protein
VKARCGRPPVIGTGLGARTGASRRLAQPCNSPARHACTPGSLTGRHPQPSWLLAKPAWGAARWQGVIRTDPGGWAALGTLVWGAETARDRDSAAVEPVGMKNYEEKWRLPSVGWSWGAIEIDDSGVGVRGLMLGLKGGLQGERTLGGPVQLDSRFDPEHQNPRAARYHVCQHTEIRLTWREDSISEAASHFQEDLVANFWSGAQFPEQFLVLWTSRSTSLTPAVQFVARELQCQHAR